uniref:Uncharacterized protein n=1 Tax=Cacopsylla melanoneura TaxID=428564 RepID=A0A8D9DNT8_9HEMI
MIINFICLLSLRQPPQHIPLLCSFLGVFFFGVSLFSWFFKPFNRRGEESGLLDRTLVFFFGDLLLNTKGEEMGLGRTMKSSSTIFSGVLFSGLGGTLLTIFSGVLFSGLGRTSCVCVLTLFKSSSSFCCSAGDNGLVDFLTNFGGSGRLF